MTVIAWDGRFVAADSMAVAGSSRVLRPVSKFKQRGDDVFGFCGSASLFDPMIDWYLAGAKPGDMPKGDGPEHESTLFVFRDGKGWFFKTNIPYAEECHPPDAWGAASDHVIGGLDAGLSAEQAIENALKREIWIGGPIQVIDLHSPKEESA